MSAHLNTDEAELVARLRAECELRDNALYTGRSTTSMMREAVAAISRIAEEREEALERVEYEIDAREEWQKLSVQRQIDLEASQAEVERLRDALTATKRMLGEAEGTLSTIEWEAGDDATRHIASLTRRRIAAITDAYIDTALHPQVKP